jgi:hypothetical protein
LRPLQLFLARQKISSWGASWDREAPIAAKRTMRSELRLTPSS